MPEINDGGPAFPQHVFQPITGGGGYWTNTGGMTLRDWFAGQALASAVDDYGQPEHNSTRGQRTDRGYPVVPYAGKAIGTREEIIARQAYRYADAMIAARDAKY